MNYFTDWEQLDDFTTDSTNFFAQIIYAGSSNGSEPNPVGDQNSSPVGPPDTVEERQTAMDDAASATLGGQLTSQISSHGSSLVATIDGSNAAVTLRPYSTIVMPNRSPQPALFLPSTVPPDGYLDLEWESPDASAVGASLDYTVAWAEATDAEMPWSFMFDHRVTSDRDAVQAFLDDSEQPVEYGSGFTYLTLASSGSSGTLSDTQDLTPIVAADGLYVLQGYITTLSVTITNTSPIGRAASHQVDSFLLTWTMRPPRIRWEMPGDLVPPEIDGVLGDSRRRFIPI